MRLRTQKNRNSLGNNTLHESYRNRRHGTTTNAVYGRLSVFLLSQHVILERYFASVGRLRKSRTPKDSKGSKGPRTPPHHSTSHRVPGSGHQVPSKTSSNNLQVLPRVGDTIKTMHSMPKTLAQRETQRGINFLFKGTTPSQGRTRATCHAKEVSILKKPSGDQSRQACQCWPPKAWPQNWHIQSRLRTICAMISLGFDQQV